MSTGYFGMPGKNGGVTHFVSSGKPICGTKQRRGATYMRCVSGFEWSYVECKRCRTKYQKTMEPKP